MVKRYPSLLPRLTEKVSWTQSQDRILIRAFNSGVNVIDMPELFEDRRYKGIEARLHLLRVRGLVGSRVPRFTPSQIDRMIALRGRGITVTEIADEMGRSWEGIRTKLRDLRRSGRCPYVWSRAMFAGYCKRNARSIQPALTFFARQSRRPPN